MADIGRRRALTFLSALSAAISPKAGPPMPVPTNSGAWWPLVREPFAGAWQRNISIDQSSILAFHAVFSCITLIASDIAKLRVKLVEQDAGGIWSETSNPAYSPVLRKPNTNQNRIQFWETWVLSKLIKGNTVALKRRDARNVVTGLWVLDWSRVKPLVAGDGSVFYELKTDNFSGLPDTVTVPAREVIHDRWNCLFHPLVGISPLFANGLAATQGLRAQESATRLFGNDATPPGILTAAGNINNETAIRLRDTWAENYGGTNRGKIAVLGDGLKYEQMSITSVEAQLIEQLRWTAEMVCSTFHVPPYKIGVGALPSFNNVQALNTEYYSQCLQVLIEAAELCLDEGLSTGDGLGTEFDLDGLLRMDSVTQAQVLREQIGAGFMSPNEARKAKDLKPVTGGESPYLQQQNFSLSALSKRDAQDDPFGTSKPAAPTAPAVADAGDEPPDDEADNGDAQRAIADLILRKSRQHDRIAA